MRRAVLAVGMTLLSLCAVVEGEEEGFVRPKSFWRPYENRYGIVVMAGNVEGQQPLYGWYWNDTSRMYRFLLDDGFPKENVFFLAYGNKAREAKGLVRGKSTTQEIRRVFGEVADRAASNDLVYLYWIDHGSRRSFGTYDGAISHDELGRLIRTIKARVFVGAFNPCHSGAVIDDIESRRSIILTSVSPHERNAWGWASHWLEALAGGRRQRSSDLDLNGRITIAEAYQWTTSLANRAGEHPLLDDNGDGKGGDLSKGTFTPDGGMGDGTRASQHALDAWLDTYPSCISWRRAVLRADGARWPGTREGLQTFLREQGFVVRVLRDEAAKKPILIYCYSRERVGGRLAPPATRCRVLNEEVLSLPHAEYAPLLGRAFHCFAVDITDLSFTESPLVNKGQVPVLVVLDEAGELSGLLRRTATDRLLGIELKKALSEERQSSLERLLQSVRPTLQRVRGLEKKVAAKRATLVRIAERFEGRPFEERAPAWRRTRDALRSAERELAEGVDSLRERLEVDD
jgi:hypothetical protein